MPRALPDRETLLSWMSAFLDGELGPEEEALLEQAMNDDPELLATFEALAAMGPLPEAALTPHDAEELAARVLSATCPDALGDTPEAAARLTSLYVDDALAPSGEARLQAALAASEQAALEALALAKTSEAVSAALDALPHAPAVAAATAPLVERIHQELAEEERCGILYSAALDGALTDAEEAELSALLSEDRADALAPLAHAAEAVGVALLAPAAHPAAARAGEAALLAIAAYAANEAKAHAGARAEAEPASAPHASLARLFGRVFAPLAFAAAAAFAFVLVAEERSASNEGKSPPAEWLAAFDDLESSSAAAPGPLDLLADNQAEVQAIDSGSHVAAVFSTEESKITVLWVSEPEPAPVGSETGT